MIFQVIFKILGVPKNTFPVQETENRDYFISVHSPMNNTLKKTFLSTEKWFSFLITGILLYKQHIVHCTEELLV